MSKENAILGLLIIILGMLTFVVARLLSDEPNTVLSIVSGFWIAFGILGTYAGFRVWLQRD